MTNFIFLWTGISCWTFSLTGGDPPISPLHLPAYCGYSAKMSWHDVELMMPYNACYITQEVGWSMYPSGCPDWSVHFISHVCFSSEWQLCAAHAVDRSPIQASVSHADSCPLSVPLSLLLFLWHGRPDWRAAAWCVDDESDRCVSSNEFRSF